MKIETKFNVEDTVHFMRDNKARKGKVDSIQIIVAKRIGRLTASPVYFVENGKQKGYLENELFATKEELLQTL